MWDTNRNKGPQKKHLSLDIKDSWYLGLGYKMVFGSLCDKFRINFLRHFCDTLYLSKILLRQNILLRWISFFLNKWDLNLIHLFVCLFLAIPHGLWDLIISLTRNWTPDPGQWKHLVPTTRPPGNSLKMYFLIEFNVFVWSSSKLSRFLQIVDIMFSILCMQIWKSYLASPLRCITWILSIKIPIDTYFS